MEEEVEEEEEEEEEEEKEEEEEEKENEEEEEDVLRERERLIPLCEVHPPLTSGSTLIKDNSRQCLHASWPGVYMPEELFRLVAWVCMFVSVSVRPLASISASIT